MALNELLRVFWQRKLLIVIVILAVVIPAYAGDASSSRAVRVDVDARADADSRPSNDLLLFTIFDTIMPFYADVASSATTLDTRGAR